jgi:hypothetical protein
MRIADTGQVLYDGVLTRTTNGVGLFSGIGM